MLASLENLEVNAIRGYFSDEGLRALSSLTGLTRLHVTGGKFVTATAIHALTASLTGLKSLTLRGFDAITDESLGSLAKLAKVGYLVWMCVDGSPYITSEGWSALKRRMSPLMTSFDALRIEWSGPHRALPRDASVASRTRLGCT